VDWTDWDTLDTLIFEGTPFGNIPFPLNWESSYLVHFGVSRYLNEGYWVAAGYFFSENSTSDRDFSPLVPDTDLHVASLGVGRKGEKWSWAVSGQVITGPKRHINNGGGMDGSYQFFNQAINLSVAYRF
jgi:long-subunit fatty acid transport protein